MGVDVDDPRHQEEPAGIDDAPGLAANLADRRDPRILDRDIDPPRLVPEPVDDRRPADQEIVHALPPH
jgi:hypothetical protein